jgi:hypothetical protein
VETARARLNLILKNAGRKFQISTTGIKNSETAVAIGTKHGRNVHWMGL